MILLLGLLGLADGSESMVLSFVVPIYSIRYANSGINVETALGTAVYVGCLIGALFTGQIADKYGRRRPLIASTVLLTIFGGLSAFLSNLIGFIICRGLLGVVIGFYSPLSFTVLSEVTPANVRGRYMALIGAFYTLGELTACVVAYLTLDSLTSGNTTALLLITTVPAIISFICFMIFLDESPRHELILGNSENAFRILEKMYLCNNKSREGLRLTAEEKQEIVEVHTKDLLREQQEEASALSFENVKQLFDGVYIRITPLVWLNWFVLTMTFFGIQYILPTTMSALRQHQDDTSSLGQIILSTIAEFPTVLVAATIIDVKFLGRKNSLGFALLMGTVGCIFSSALAWPGFIFWVSVARFFFNLSFSLNYQYTSELYPTKCRATGNGMASCVGRFGGIIMPAICSMLGKIGTLAPYVFFGVATLVSGLLTFTIPIDTTGLTLGNLDT